MLEKNQEERNPLTIQEINEKNENMNKDGGR